MSDIDDDKNIQKLLQIRLSYFLFTIPYEVVFMDFAYLLVTADLRSNSLLVRIIYITCTILWQDSLLPIQFSLV